MAVMSARRRYIYGTAMAIKRDLCEPVFVSAGEVSRTKGEHIKGQTPTKIAPSWVIQ